MNFHNLLSELKSQFLQVRKYLDADSTLSNEKEPYKNKYAAIEILNSMHKSLLEIPEDSNNQENEEITSSLLTVVCLNLGILYIEVDELSTGEKFLMICIDNINITSISPEKIIPTISAFNQLGILWSQRDQIPKAEEFLKLSEEAYKNYKKLSLEPISMASLFDITSENEPEGNKVLEKLHTLTLYYLAQVYGTMKEYLKSAIYCHMTLSRQLEEGEFENIEWALNAATLSQFFLEKDKFHQARYYLSAASYILKKYEINLENLDAVTTENDTNAAKWENFKHRSADVARCWAKYGILLLSASKERLLRKIEEENDNESKYNNIINNESDFDEENFKSLNFVSLSNEINEFQNDITADYLLDFNDARLIFLKVQKWLDKAKEYYSLDNHASDYVQIMQDKSQAYKYLAFYENNEDRQAKMHKRRIDILEGTVKELNVNYYQAVCRQIWMELGETYSEILDIKLDRLQADDKKSRSHLLSKINNLAASAIKNFENFLNSIEKEFKIKESQQFPDELIRSILYSYFHLGRLYNKFIIPDKKLQMENIKKSLDAYNFLVNYCEKNSRAEELMAAELEISKEFVKLLPVRMEKLQNQINLK